MGKHMLRLLKFAITYSGWHTYGKDRSTVSALTKLSGLGLIEVNRETRQFRLAQPKEAQRCGQFLMTAKRIVKELREKGFNPDKACELYRLIEEL